MVIPDGQTAQLEDLANPTESTIRVAITAVQNTSMIMFTVGNIFLNINQTTTTMLTMTSNGMTTTLIGIKDERDDLLGVQLPLNPAMIQHLDQSIKKSNLRSIRNTLKSSFLSALALLINSN